MQTIDTRIVQIETALGPVYRAVEQWQEAKVTAAAAAVKATAVEVDLAKLAKEHEDLRRAHQMLAEKISGGHLWVKGVAAGLGALGAGGIYVLLTKV